MDVKGNFAKSEEEGSGITETSIQRVCRGLQKIAYHAPKKNIDLKKGCEIALEYIAKIQSHTDNADENERKDRLDSNGVPTDLVELDKLANKLSKPLRLACYSRNTKLMSLGLDILQKCLAYHYFRGGCIDEEEPEHKLMESIIKAIRSCFDYPDDNVQLQVVQACLTAVTEPFCDVHEGLLMNCVQSIYYICLLTKNPANQTSAKGALTQLLHTIFQRMELKMSPDVVIGMDENFDDESFEGNNNLEFNVKPKQRTLLQKLSGTGPESSFEEKEEKKIETIEVVAKNIILKIITDITGISDNFKEKKTSEAHYIFTDCYQIFRALCKLSMKPKPKDSVDASSIDMRSKILALELLHSILEKAGPVFRSFDKFINSAIKKHLVISVLMNGVSTNTTVFKLSIFIFLDLVSYFKDYLKHEIGVFYSKILLLILESANSVLDQKFMVFQALLEICKNPQALVDIFVNYDCGLEGENIFERMVNALSKISQRKILENNPQELRLQSMGLECLVTIMKSLVDWSKDLRIEKSLITNNNTAESSFVKEGESFEESKESFEESTSTPIHKEGPNFYEMKQKKKLLALGISKFNLSSKKGMLFCIEKGLVNNDPESVAHFLKSTPGLDKSKIGEYLGEITEFNKNVLHAYIDSFSFKDMHIDIALRKMLATFRLPGEAQKIDRMMEKFAERYFEDNKNVGIFACADAVFIVSFAIVMLATDLHSPYIKDKMTKPQWHSMQRKVNDGKDFPEDFLDGIYDRIAEKRLSLNDEEETMATAEDLSDPKQRKILFQKEMERSIFKSKRLIKEKAGNKSVYYRAKQIEHVRPMFEVSWPAMLAAFSVLLEQSEDPETINLCLDGFKHAIRVSCTFFMETERNTFVSSLSKFTYLNNLAMMKQKNIESVRALMEIAKTEANFLQDSWFDILYCISHLEQLHLVGLGAKSQALPIFPDESSKMDIKRKIQRHKRTPSNTTQYSFFEQPNASTVANQIEGVDIDRIFSNSSHLSNNAIEDFVKALCQISRQEIESPNPRMFSLQKIVELAYFNMDRIRIVWARIWRHLADHFETVGQHENLRISMYGIDSLKQLAMKFLEKPELAHYHFQKEFLAPFETIMKNHSSVKIRDMIIRCFANMVASKAHNFKSGWKSIFSVCKIAASDHDETIVRLAFEIVIEIKTKHFQIIVDQFFVDYVGCLVAYANGHIFFDVSLKAIEFLEDATRKWFNGEVVQFQIEENSNVIFTETDKNIKLWFPIFTGFSRTVGHSHVDVRTLALKTLFITLNTYGKNFSGGLWDIVFRGVLLPIFDNVNHASENEVVAEDNEWLTTTCLLAFESLIKLFSTYFKEMSFLLPELLNLISGCILQDNESLARIGAGSFLRMVMNDGNFFTEDMWTSICKKLHEILQKNIPYELMKAIEQGDDLIQVEEEPFSNSRLSIDRTRRKQVIPKEPLINQNHKIDEQPNGNSTTKEQRTINIKIIRGKFTVQLVMIEALNEIISTHYKDLKSNHLVLLLQALEEAYNFIHALGENILLKNKLENTELPNLWLKQEMSAISSIFRVLFRMYSEETNEEKVSIAEMRLLNLAKSILSMFVEKSIKNTISKEDSKRINSYSQIVVQILKGIQDFYDIQFEKHLKLFYPFFNELILTEHLTIRQVLRQIHLRVGKMKQILE